jgi:murein DD-endopeptidase MepM/ murein hydrolase activator NlpD
MYIIMNKFIFLSLYVIFFFQIALGADKIEIIKERDGDLYKVSVKNTDNKAYIVQIDLNMENMQTDVSLPFEKLIPANSQLFAFNITRTDSTQPSTYSLSFTWRSAERESRNCVDEFCIITKTVGDSIHFYLENNQFIPVTLTFIPEEFENVATHQNMPFTRSYAGDKRTKMFSAWLVDPWGARHTGYRYQWQFGVINMPHDDSYAYALPYEKGRKYIMSQGPNGSESHQGKFAFDWDMPEGSAIHAARDGIVIDVIENFTRGGASESYRNQSNAIEIMHRDGSVGRYSHLQQNGALVELGDRVARGQKIGLSGNTGYSSGPHLHFDVVQLQPDLSFKTLPIKFQVSPGKITDLRAGDRYGAFE